MIVEYEDKFLKDVQRLLVELEEYIISIDKDGLDRLHPDYEVKYTENALKLVKENEGKCYLYLEDDKVVGLIMGIVPPYDDLDYLDYKCPRRGEILELIVSKSVRSHSIGTDLISRMEEYFCSIGCEYVKVDVFAYNENAIKFYCDKHGYHSRMYNMIKKISAE